jgi:hypothetical protein
MPVSTSRAGDRLAPPGRHPWWRHVPAADRSRRRLELQRVRLLAHLRRRRAALLAALLVYGWLCLLPLTFGQPHLTLLALLPLLAVPPVAYLAYLIAWHEFHR